MATQYSREADVALALKMADAADVISMARYQSQDLVITTKPDNTPVTDADKATELYNTLNTSNILYFKPLEQEDFARDGYHYDILTATRYANCYVDLL
jgi:hypothetical protein